MNQFYYGIQEKRDEKSNSSQKKSKFKTYKNNAVHSFNEIEYFLRNFRTASKYIKLYKFFK